MKTPIVLLHGWGQSPAIWHQQIKAFAGYPLHPLALPGHAGHQDVAAEQWLDELMSRCPKQAFILCAWSLSGLLALSLAQRYPQRILGLNLIASTPCFVQADDWPHGCTKSVLDGFEQLCKQASPALLNRFFMLMFHGDKLPRSHYRSCLKDAVDRQHPPTQAGLEAGLTILKTWDVRSLLPDIKQACCLIHGKNDAIIPVEAAHALTSSLSNASMHSLCDAGHAPMLSQAHTVNQILESWWIKHA